MNVFNQFLIKMKKKTQRTKDQNRNSTSSWPGNKKFSSIRWRKKMQPRSTDEDPQSPQLLTQCIETALFIRNPLPPKETHKRWSFEDVVKPSNVLRFEEPIKPARTRKISLPPQLSNIGYLASIPEVDSQLSLDLYHSDTSTR